MSLIICGRHARKWDSDVYEECPECEVECEYCGGEGTVNEDVDDGEGHIMRGVGKAVPCICQIEK